MNTPRTRLHGEGRCYVLQGDAARLPLPDASVDLVVTSPPYWRQRVYEDGGVPVAGQHGLEETVAEYLDTLVAATAEWVRVLRPDGNLWVNLGDKQQRGSLLLLPQRYAFACADRLGLTVRAEVVWDKPSAKPEGNTGGRVRRTHEHWLHLTCGLGHFSDLDPLRQQRAATTRSTVGHAVRQVPGQRPDTWSGDGHPAGPVPGSVWRIPAEPLSAPWSYLHTAAMPTEIARRIVLGWSPPDGTVLDPYAGSGTVGHVAAALGRTGIAVDRSAAYTRVAADTDLAHRRAVKVRTGKPGSIADKGAETLDLFDAA
jgi:DNA modification methylase